MTAVHGQLEQTEVAYDLICLSHLRWDFVYQRPQHLISRFARERRVFFVEEPTFEDGPARLDLSPREGGLIIATPRLPHGIGQQEAEAAQRSLLDGLIHEQGIAQFVLWYYTPMALGFSDHLEPLAIVFDAMDELSAFLGAPPLLLEREAELLKKADLVFTGGYSIYEAKKDRAARVYPFPSSVDVPHFAAARQPQADPEDQAAIPHPRLGFFGVIDERFDIELVRGIAEARPEWHLVMLGPVVKIDPASLPHLPNVHYPGGKKYTELPAYIAGWDVALLPFARNESTRFISPTKTPEYLAAGKPVISTPIRDVIRPYGDGGLVQIAETVAEFVAAIERALQEDRAVRLSKVDPFLAQLSWERTWAEMRDLINTLVLTRHAAPVGATSH